MALPVYRIGPCHVFLGNPNIPDGAGMTFLGFTRDTCEFSPNVNISYGKTDQTGTAGLAESVYFGGYAPVASVPLVDEDQDKLEAYIGQVDYQGRHATVGAIVAPAGGNATVALAGVTQFRMRDGVYTLTVTTGGNEAASRWTLKDPDGRTLQEDILAGAGATGINTEHFSAKLRVGNGNVVANQVYSFTVADVVASLGAGSGFTTQDIGTLALIPSAQLGQGVNGIDAKQAVWLPACIANDFGAWGFETPDSSDDAMNRRSTQFMGLRIRIDDRPVTLGGERRDTEAEKTLLPGSHRIWWIGSPRSMGRVMSGGTSYAAPSWSLPVAPRG